MDYGKNVSFNYICHIIDNLIIELGIRRINKLSITIKPMRIM